MVKIQVNLNEEENKIVGVCRVVEELETKEEAVKFIIRKYK